MDASTSNAGERLGDLGGWLAAPWTFSGSWLRASRVFHPSGLVLRGHVVPAVTGGAALALAERMQGPVLLRFSGAWWKRHQWPDVLGLALRCTRDASSAQSHAGDQDLLFATIRHPLTTALAPLSTDVSDYLANDYFGVSPFDADGLGRVKLRVTPLSRVTHGSDRRSALLEALRAGPLELLLETRPDRLAARYAPLVRIRIEGPATCDARELRFDPFVTGRGLQPVGFVHHVRRMAYAASRFGRALR